MSDQPDHEQQTTGQAETARQAEEAAVERIAEQQLRELETRAALVDRRIVQLARSWPELVGGIWYNTGRRDRRHS